MSKNQSGSPASLAPASAGLPLEGGAGGYFPGARQNLLEKIQEPAEVVPDQSHTTRDGLLCNSL